MVNTYIGGKKCGPNNKQTKSKNGAFLFNALGYIYNKDLRKVLKSYDNFRNGNIPCKSMCKIEK